MDISLRLYKGVVQVPTSYIVVRDGFFVTDTPLESVPVKQTERLRQAIQAAIERGNPSISRDEARVRLHRKDDPLLQATGARSWFALDRETKGLWGLIEKDGLYQIRVSQPMKTHGWHEDETKRVLFPPGTAIEDVIDRLIMMMQECARE
jgi:hypothetical protein